MRAFPALLLALGGLGCGAPSAVEPRTPVDAQRSNPFCARAPAIEDGFPAAFRRSQEDDPYRVTRPRSIDLGAIGDAPIGQEPPRPRSIPEWQKPFPCHWTHTCRSAPVVRYEPEEIEEGY